jgi:hypothetical protein
VHSQAGAWERGEYKTEGSGYKPEPAVGF